MGFPLQLETLLANSQVQVKTVKRADYRHHNYCQLLVVLALNSGGAYPNSAAACLRVESTWAWEQHKPATIRAHMTMLGHKSDGVRAHI